MTEEVKIRLDRFEQRIRRLIYDYDEARAEISELRDKLSAREAEIARLREEADTKSVMYQNLRTARTIGVHDKDIDVTRGRLDRLAREVDTCIAKLTHASHL